MTTPEEFDKKTVLVTLKKTMKHYLNFKKLSETAIANLRQHHPKSLELIEEYESILKKAFTEMGNFENKYSEDEKTWTERYNNFK